ncbi:hypothetical protein CCR95_10010 [Thiocystis minor]|nr:hypothetical protein [Thiocystis minor]
MTAFYTRTINPAPWWRAPFEMIGELLTREGASIAETIRRHERTRYAWEEVCRLTDEMWSLFADLTGSGREPRFAERTTNLIVVDSQMVSQPLPVAEIGRLLGECISRPSTR